LKKGIYILMISAIMTLTLTLAVTNAQVSTDEHVYYGYVPPSTDVYNPGVSTEAPAPETEARTVQEIIKGILVDYFVPTRMTILDVIGLQDGTSIEIWDIFADQKINSTTINKFEKKVFFIPIGTFFKIVASARIGALLNGGASVYEPDGREEPPGGTSTFYPAVTGGFRGKEFIFNAAPPTHAIAYSTDRIGYNFYLMDLEETDWQLSDSVQGWSSSGHLPQRGTKTLLLQSRTYYHAAAHGGAGTNVVFHLTTSSDVEVSCCCGLSDFVAVPAITGGYVGKLFYAPVSVTFEAAGRTAAFIAVPLEEGEVKIYDKDLNVMATHSFTASDVSDRHFWYYDLGVGRFNLIAESTGDITFMVGQTEGTAEIGYLGDDITFIGSKPNQEIRFYAPTMAVIFASEDLTITIDGNAPMQMAGDDFRLLDSGVHSISADKHVIVEVLAAGSGWNNWGSYLIEPADVDVSFEAPEGFLSKPVDYTIYIAGAVVAVVVVLAVFMMRRRRPRQV